ncbi:MAG: hypothetical protein H6735_00960 [Alphaproteobacteria bacterium]|nr:hypothetical protein [Alphaproteobacteria bacterium]
MTVQLRTVLEDAVAQPQITEIATYFASRMPTEGVPEDQAREAWRSSLRYARQTGAIDPLTRLIETTEPEDTTLREHCEKLRT